MMQSHFALNPGMEVKTAASMQKSDPKNCNSSDSELCIEDDVIYCVD